MITTAIALFWSFLGIGLFGFGGGYAILPLIQRQVVDVHAWMTMREFADILAVAQMTPGPVAINTATYVGFRTAGLVGALVATAGVIAAPIVVVSIVARLADRFLHSRWVQGALTGLRGALIALIAYSAYAVALVSFDRIGVVVLSGATLVLLRRTRINPLWFVAAAAVIGAALF